MIRKNENNIRFNTMVSGIACQPTSKTIVVLVGFIRVVQLTAFSSLNMVEFTVLRGHHPLEAASNDVNTTLEVVFGVVDE